MDSSGLLAPINYEKRIVIFFDVLGWKSHIQDAGDDPDKVGRLALLPKILQSLPVLQAAEAGSPSDVRITSFSDCCVISVPYDESALPSIIYGLSNTFIGSALMGFLLRAGVTIGNLYHEGDIVFGPAMNRAYSLESTGVYPRVVLDPDIPSFSNLNLFEGMILKCDCGLFVDPYTLSFVRSEYCQNPIANEKFMVVDTDKALTLYTMLQQSLESILGKAKTEEHRKRANWPYARVRSQLRLMLNH